ncbi:MAG: ribosome biogenesis GTP-binding protein YihA/YsxC [Alphaproteobacteria bacterium]
MESINQTEQTERHEVGRRFFTRTWTFVMGAPTAAAIPPAAGVEVAFAGRSNVGKSSLINALTARRALARTSNTPGRTQQLNYFDNGTDLRLVDMPGYGYARAPKTQVAAWTTMMFDYLRGRPNLRRVYVLIDARHGLKKPDRDVLTMLDKAAVSYQIALTKCDKPKQPALDAIITATAEELRGHPAAHPDILMTSSLEGRGLDDLRAEIAVLADKVAYS